MDIGIYLDNGDYELSETDEIICEYGTDMEVGYLKINPERIPVVVGQKRAEEEFEKFGDSIVEISIMDGKYVLIADKKNIEMTGEKLIVISTAYIAKNQIRSYTALTGGEIEEWTELFEESEEYGDEDDEEDRQPAFCYMFPTIVFDYDDKTGSFT